MLQTITGIGPVTATARCAALSDVTPSMISHPLAAWLGLVLWEHSMGGQPRLQGMSTRGTIELRRWFVNGGRATRRWVEPYRS